LIQVSAINQLPAHLFSASFR